MVWVEQQPRHHDGLAPGADFSRRRVLLRAAGGVVPEPQVELPLRDPVGVEVGGQGGDVAHVGVVHQGLEGDGAAVQEIKYLGSSPRPRNRDGIWKNGNQVTWSLKHCATVSNLLN